MVIDIQGYFDGKRGRLVKERAVKFSLGRDVQDVMFSGDVTSGLEDIKKEGNLTSGNMLIKIDIGFYKAGLV